MRRERRALEYAEPLRERWVVVIWGEVGGGEGCFLFGVVEGVLLEEEEGLDFCLSASSRISVSVRRSIIVRMWWVVVRFEIAVGEAVAGRAER